MANKVPRGDLEVFYDCDKIAIYWRCPGWPIRLYGQALAAAELEVSGVAASTAIAQRRR